MGATLPEICLKCGETSNLETREHRFESAPRGLYFSFLLSPIAFLILAALTRRFGKATISLCEVCDARWRDANLARTLSVPLGVAATVAIATAAFNDAPALAAVLLVVSSASILWIQARFVSGRTLDVIRLGDGTMTLAGVAEAAAKAATRTESAELGARSRLTELLDGRT